MRKEILLIIVKNCIYNFETFVVKLSETLSIDFKNGEREKTITANLYHESSASWRISSVSSLNLIKQLITNNNLIRPILDKVRNYILFNYVYPVHDRGSVLFDYRSRETVHELTKRRYYLFSRR